MGDLAQGRTSGGGRLVPRRPQTPAPGVPSPTPPAAQLSDRVEQLTRAVAELARRVERLEAGGQAPEAAVPGDVVAMLCEVRGVGKARAEAVAEAFDGVARLAAASPDEVVRSAGVPGVVAERLLAHVRARMAADPPGDCS